MCSSLPMKENACEQSESLRISAEWFRLQERLFIETEFDDLFVERPAANPKRFGGCFHAAFMCLDGFADELAFKSSYRLRAAYPALRRSADRFG